MHTIERSSVRRLRALDGILIETVVEEREPGIAVVVVAIDLDRGTNLGTLRSFTYLAQTKIFAGISATNNQLLSATGSKAPL
jgi:hypothetical protein